jgi:hypothetical protein
MAIGLMGKSAKVFKKGAPGAMVKTLCPKRASNDLCLRGMPSCGLFPGSQKGFGELSPACQPLRAKAGLALAALQR